MWKDRPWAREEMTKFGYGSGYMDLYLESGSVPEFIS